MSNYPVINNDTINPNDPNFTYTEWDNFNGEDWDTSIANCHGFGNITLITHKDQPTLKLFIAKEISDILEYDQTKNMQFNLNSTDFNVPNWATLNKINGLAEALGREVPSRGFLLINYSGFNNAIMKSTKPNAKIIQQWIYGSVMPQVAETGSYNNDDLIFKLENRITNLENMIKQMMVVLESQYEQLKTINNNVLKIESSPPITFDGFAEPKTVRKSFDIMVFTKHINRKFNRNYGRNTMYDFLRQLGLIELGSSKPSRKAIKEDILSIEHFIINYEDGSTGKSIRTVMFNDKVKDIIRQLKVLKVI